MLKVNKRFNLVDESPWFFFVSAASLFLTLGAVLSFCDSEVQSMMLSGLGGRLLGSIRKTALNVMGSYGGAKINNYTNTPTEYIYSGVVYTPSNYSITSINLLKNLAVAYINKDTKTIYAIWRLVMCNPEGIFSDNYGKLSNTVNVMTNDYNARAASYEIVTEKGFLENQNLSASPKSLSLIQFDQYNSLVETIQMEIANRKSQGYLEYQRNPSELSVAGVANLGLQPNNDCITLVRYDKNTGGFHLCYVDCKKLGEDALKLKLKTLRSQGYDIENIQGSRFIFGCNLYMVATKADGVYLDPQEVKVVMEFISKIAEKNPNFFKDYENSKEFVEFKTNGNLAALSTSVYPFPKVLMPQDFQKYLRYNKFADQELTAKYVASPKVDCENKLDVLSDLIDQQ